VKSLGYWNSKLLRLANEIVYQTQMGGKAGRGAGDPRGFAEDGRGAISWADSNGGGLDAAFVLKGSQAFKEKSSPWKALREANRTMGGVVAFSYPEMIEVERAFAEVALEFPCVPGFLSFRESAAEASADARPSCFAAGGGTRARGESVWQRTWGLCLMRRRSVARRACSSESAGCGPEAGRTGGVNGRRRDCGDRAAHAVRSQADIFRKGTGFRWRRRSR
jgi:Endonuclease V